MPLSNYGPDRIPRSVTPQVVLGQAERVMKIKSRQAQETRVHNILKQFTAKGVPKNRFFNLMCDNPLLADCNSEGNNAKDFLESDSKSSLGEFFGFESDDDVPI